jgi:carbamoyl-phosphate synthase large subunit
MTASPRIERPDVLVTSAARKVLLVRAFREAQGRVGEGGRVLAADLDPWAVARREADGVVELPRSDDPSFGDALERACAAERIGLVVPTRDEELLVFSAMRERMAEAGTVILISPPESIAVCRDKIRFAKRLAEIGVDTPRILSLEDPALPAFVKPRVGAGSRHARVVRTPEELAAATSAIRAAGGEPVAQELVDGSEHTVDVFLDLAGQPISCVPRERVQVVNGESVVSRTVRDDALARAAIRVCQALGLVGHITVQAFRTSDRIVLIEVNPRFGGAANLGFAAGAPTPEFAIRMARGEFLGPQLDRYEVGLVMLRYSDDRFEHAPVLATDVAAR